VKRFASLVVAIGALSAGLVFALSTGAASASHARASSSLPTLTIALTGTKSVSVSSTSVPSGALSVTATFSGKAPSGKNANSPTWGIARLNPGATLSQAVSAVNAAHGDLNAIDPYGALVAAGSPGTFQVNLTPGTNYVALNETGNGGPAFAPFTVTQSSSPASLPTPGATVSSIEFGFRGPTTLHDGELVRFQNKGYLVHMDVFFRVKNKKAANQAMTYLLAGKDNKVGKLVRGMGTFQGPVSPGGLQQEVVSAKPGVYVQACFMTTQDGREHTRLGMERMFKITK
jgi:hypothetical protein